MASYAPMKARLVNRLRRPYRDGTVETMIWEVPHPVPPSMHCYKYRLVYIVAGERIVGYDNEFGKGDHKHLRGTELPYAFRDIDELLADFMADVDGVNHED